MKILYISSAVSNSRFSSYNKSLLRQKNLYGMPIAGNKFHNNIMKGLSINDEISKIDSLSFIPISREIDRRIFIKSSNDIEEDIHFHYPAVFNIPIMKNVIYILYLFLYIFYWNYKNIGSKRRIVFDGAFITAAPVINILKCVLNYKTTTIFMDVYDYMSTVGTSNNQSNAYLNKLLTSVMRNIYSLADSYVFLSEEMNNVFNAESKKNYCIIEGLVNTNKMVLKNYSNISTDPFVIMYSGALKEVYGIKKLVESLNFLDDNVELWIFGSGSFENELKEREITEPRIKFFGAVSNEIVIEYQQKANLLVNPRPANLDFTKYSFPSKLLEYMASGIPTLSTKLGNLTEEYLENLAIIHDETSKGFADKISEIIANYTDYLEIACVAQKFIFEKKDIVIQTRKIVEGFNHD